MTDHAQKIRLAIQVLNSAIREAAEDGIKIEELQEIDATSIYDKCRAVVYNPIIVKKEYL